MGRYRLAFGNVASSLRLQGIRFVCFKPDRQNLDFGGDPGMNF